jgi:hypothetical protein
MRALLFIVTIAMVGSAYADPITDPQRAAAAQRQADAQRRIEQAQERCNANRGTDCDTLDGLQEWLMLDRSRADAVLDRISPLGGSASAGASVPEVVRPGVPDTSPRNVPSGR